MRVLVAAFACHPGRGSEPGVGWAVAIGAVRAGHEVVLVTQPRHRAAIERARQTDPEVAGRLEPVYLGLPGPVMDAWDRYAGLRGLQGYNLAWQAVLLATGRRLHRRRPFDLAHHVTLSTDWVPSGLAWVADLPLVWGPLGGGERVPGPCRRWLGARGLAREWARRVAADPLRAVLGAAAARRCALLVAQNPEEASRLGHTGPPVITRPNVFLEVETFLGHDDVGRDDDPAPAVAGDGSRRSRAVFAGQLVAWKGVHLALAVMARPAVRQWELHLYGDGPERRAVERDVRRLGLTDRVVLHGSRPREEVRAAMASADAFLYPSMREAAGWVVAEALMTGCPVVCLDIGGPPLLLRGTGRAVAPGPDMVGQLAEALAGTAGAQRRVVRWDTAALPSLLDEWYQRAVQSARHPDIRNAHAR